MRKITLTAFLCLSLLSRSHSQDAVPNITVKWAPTALVTGNLNLQAEYNFGGKHSLTASLGLPVTAKHAFTYQGNDANFQVKTSTFLAGYRTYLSQKHLSGMYFEPYFKYAHLSGDGTGTGTLDYRTAKFNFVNEYNGIGIGAQLGAQFLIGNRFTIDLFFLGPELNYATNHFKAIEVNFTRPWTEREALQAQLEVNRFINQFPFIRNRTKIMVDKDSRTILAQFRGAIPGIRTGVSFGVAF